MASDWPRTFLQPGCFCLVKSLHVAGENIHYLKYFKLAKPTDDHLPDPEGILSSKLPSSAIASANSEVRSVIDGDPIHHFPTRVYCLAPRRLMWLLSAKITIDRVEKFAKLSSA